MQRTSSRIIVTIIIREMQYRGMSNCCMLEL